MTPLHFALMLKGFYALAPQGAKPDVDKLGKLVEQVVVEEKQPAALADMPLEKE